MPKALRTLSFSFDEKHLTHFGGLVLMHRFCQRLGLRRLLQRQVELPQRNADYRAADLILALLYATIAGLRRINKTELLQYNGTFIDLLGLSRFPDQSTLRRFLQRLPVKSIRQLVGLHDQLRGQLFWLPKVPTSLIFDLDSVVLTLYGHQQGARVGYNPKKKGRRSYHPLLCFEAYRQEFWHGSLRPGDTSANTGVVFFFQRCLAKVSPHIGRSRIRVRADSGFFGGKFIGSLENQGLGYVIVAKEYRPIKERARAARFHKLKSGFEVAEFRYQAPRLAQGSPLCGDAPSDTRRPGRGQAIDTLQGPSLRLQCVRHQSRPGALAHLEILSTPRRHREEHPRTALRFAAGQDPLGRLGGQCSVFSTRAFRVQLGSLVPATVPAGSVQDSNCGDRAHGFSGAAGALGQSCRAQRAAIAQGLFSSGYVRGSVRESEQAATAEKIVILQVTRQPKPHFSYGFHT